MIGKLYVCPTPIGNLKDITMRTLEVLQNVDYIAAEDTRHTIKLLNHYEIKTALISYYEHNEATKSDWIIEKLQEGKDFALVTDAGTPGISDPGSVLIQKLILLGIEIIVLPGATAFVPALVVSGLNTNRFVFEGFLPVKKGDKRRQLETLKYDTRTIVLYESPHRLLETLESLHSVLGNRRMAICRELTKKFEEIVRGSIEECLHYFKENILKGEFVLVISGLESEKTHLVQDEDMDQALKQLIQEGYTKKDAIKYLVEQYGWNKKTLYKKSLEL